MQVERIRNTRIQSEQVYGTLLYKLLMNVPFPLVVVPGTAMDVMKKSRRIKFHPQINY